MCGVGSALFRRRDDGTGTRLLLIVALMAASSRVVFGEVGSEQVVANTSAFPFAEYAGIALKVGTGITALLALVKGLSEWTASGRKKGAMDRVVRLSEFIRAITRINADELRNEVLEARDKARKELADTSAECYPNEVPPSKFRRLFLIYLPSRWLAYVPHILFFTLWGLVGAAAYSALTDDSQDMTGREWLGLLVFLVSLILFMQRWAALEWRRRTGEVAAPVPLRFGLHWYPANSFLGLISNALLVLQSASLLFMPLVIAAGTAREPSLRGFLPAWQQAVIVRFDRRRFGTCHLFLVAS